MKHLKWYELSWKETNAISWEMSGRRGSPGGKTPSQGKLREMAKGKQRVHFHSYWYFLLLNHNNTLRNNYNTTQSHCCSYLLQYLPKCIKTPSTTYPTPHAHTFLTTLYSFLHRNSYLQATFVLLLCLHFFPEWLIHKAQCWSLLPLLTNREDMHS